MLPNHRMVGVGRASLNPLCTALTSCHWIPWRSAYPSPLSLLRRAMRSVLSLLFSKLEKQKKPQASSHRTILPALSPDLFPSSECNVPAKSGLVSRDHTASFPSWVSWGVPCSAKLIFWPTYLTYNPIIQNLWSIFFISVIFVNWRSFYKYYQFSSNY